MNTLNAMIEARHMETELVPWNPLWHDMFLKEQAILSECLQAAGLTAEILHVGSTSIEGMCSKPIIDILILVPDLANPEDYARALADRGVNCLGECRRKGRIFMSHDAEDISFYIHATTRDNPVAQDQLLFQRLERGNETIRQNYMFAKRLAATMFSSDRTMYRESKGLYIEGVLAAYRMAERQYADKTNAEKEL